MMPKHYWGYLWLLLPLFYTMPLHAQITAPPSISPDLRQDRYPLAKLSPIRRPYGQQRNPETNAIEYSSGVDLDAPPGTSVYAVAAGTVAFAGTQSPWGNLVVINHTNGRQTRYGYLSTLNVKKGQSIQRGSLLGNVQPGDKGFRFELRYRSTKGWVAHDPQPYLRAIAPPLR